MFCPKHTSLPALVPLQTAEASDKLRDIIAPMAGGLSSAFTPLKGMVSQNILDVEHVMHKLCCSSTV